MAVKTSKQVQGDVYRLLRDSELARNLSGSVYRKGMRPRDSCSEDAVVIFMTGFSAQIQTGVVVVHIYVPDIGTNKTGALVEDGQRTEAIEKLAEQWVKTLNTSGTCYKFRLQQAIYTENEPDINQHFVVVKLAYEYYDGEE